MKDWNGHGSAPKLSRAHQIEVAICYLAGIPIKDITKVYGTSRSAIHRLLVRLDVPTERGKRS